MSLLDYPEPQALVNDADVIFPTVKDCADRLIKFFAPTCPSSITASSEPNPLWSYAVSSAAWSAKPASRLPSRPGCRAN